MAHGADSQEPNKGGLMMSANRKVTPTGGFPDASAEHSRRQYNADGQKTTISHDLLSRLERVRQSGPDRWMASCPAHEDKRASLSIRGLPDGQMLIHCFAGCGADEIVGAVGMTIGDLFPDRVDYQQRRAPRIPASDILAAIALEIEVVMVAASDLAKGLIFNEVDHDRLRLAVNRIRAAVGVANGSL